VDIPDSRDIVAELKKELAGAQKEASQKKAEANELKTQVANLDTQIQQMSGGFGIVSRDLYICTAGSVSTCGLIGSGLYGGLSMDVPSGKKLLATWYELVTNTASDYCNLGVFPKIDLRVQDPNHVSIDFTASGPPGVQTHLKVSGFYGS
jgi:hypothetical protein